MVDQAKVDTRRRIDKIARMDQNDIARIIDEQEAEHGDELERQKRALQAELMEIARAVAEPGTAMYDEYMA
eukprot:CAMPEP_0182892682 /NCGR_PEP_ID=MMETSP0034_2-20130328/24023_1 /TAXON_ID=156128 /ORGANISM="Nephroselmis pyriformis, Strain CCMP717" /LENGTH=70 /DNA_ID=CAMNT_0025026381 /DNA_START=1 /DNA_END=209 /DNA_ORIENTATION=+